MVGPVGVEPLFYLKALHRLKARAQAQPERVLVVGLVEEVTRMPQEGLAPEELLS
jgi:hypothetical protein